MAEIKSSSHRSTNKQVFDIITSEDIRGKKILDIGAGKGHMAQLLGNHVLSKGVKPGDIVFACDLYPEYFSYEDIICKKMEFINELPFDSGSFDVAYAIEVIEHLENPYNFIKEIYRIIRPGGKAIITTPNILNLSSRISYLFSGFFELFGPLSFDPQDARRKWGHIMPLNAYYLSHAMRACGFTRTDFLTDRLKRSSLFLYVMLMPILKLSALRYAYVLQKKKPAVYESNKQELKVINGLKLCCSRSAVLVGYK